MNGINHPLTDRISDTRYQGCTSLQSLVTCLEHGDIVAQYAVTQRCLRLHHVFNAICIVVYESFTANHMESSHSSGMDNTTTFNTHVARVQRSCKST